MTHKIAQYTTLIPFGLDEQLHKLEGWRKAHDGPIHTVNHSREFSVLAPQLPDWVIPVELRFVQKFGRDYVPLPSLLEAINRSRPKDVQRIVLANADIEIARPEAIDILRDPGCDLLFASRNDIDAKGDSAGLYRKGYDVFSLSPEALSMLDLKGVFLGLPWWDYVLPIFSILTGRSVRRLDTDAFHHRIHPQRWSLVGFNYIGWQFMRQVLPDELCDGAPSASRVMDFAKVANQFLNSSVFAQQNLPDPVEVRAQFLDAVMQATGTQTSDPDNTNCPVKMMTRFTELTDDMFALYQKAIAQPDTPDLMRQFANLKARAAAAGPAGNESFDRYEKLIALHLGA